jgi:hypothetical protein
VWRPPREEWEWPGEAGRSAGHSEPVYGTNEAKMSVGFELEIVCV